MLYALISSGLIGFSFFILFSVLVFIKCIQALLSRKKNYFISLSVLLILIIFLRSLVESSYAVFGIDFVVFTIFLFLNKHLKKIQND